ncbi:MAG: hypothetical protein ACFCBV_14225 [Phycisphaerales bacterium]
MATVPNRKQDMITFFATRLPAWQADPAAIGLSAEQVAALGVRLQAAQDAAGVQATKQAEAKAATEASNTEAQSLRGFGGSLINVIRAFAEASDDPSVYSAAQIPAPADPTPAPAPGMPTDITAAIDNAGSIDLAFKAENAQPHTGTVFEIRRKLDTESAFTLIGTSGEKAYSDATIPAGTTSAVYTITARRGELSSGTSENIFVRFSGAGNPGVQGEAGGQQAA